jgi:hypothetical protein
MGFKLVYQEANGEERFSREISNEEAALIQARYDQIHGVMVLRIEGPNGLIRTSDYIETWGKANPDK